MLKDKFYWVETERGFCPVFTLIPEEKSPIVLFCHDYKGSCHETNRLFWHLSRSLYKAGIGSVRFDYNGFGNSSGNSAGFTIETAANDALTVLRQVRTLPNVNEECISLIGIGMGGRIAACLLGNISDLKAGILLNPADSHFKNKEELEELTFGFEGDTAWDGGCEFSKDFFNAELFGKGSEEITESATSVMIITGYDDDFIFHKTSEAYREKLPSIRYEEIMDADHYFSSPDAYKEVETLVISFLKETLLGEEHKVVEKEALPPEVINNLAQQPLDEESEDSPDSNNPVEEESSAEA